MSSSSDNKLLQDEDAMILWNVRNHSLIDTAQQTIRFKLYFLFYFVENAWVSVAETKFHIICTFCLWHIIVLNFLAVAHSWSSQCQYSQSCEMLICFILNVLQTETALMYDAVHLFAEALHALDSSQRIDIKPLSCDNVDTWPHGYSLINYMRVVSIIIIDCHVL